MTLEPGRMLTHYRLVERIGEGGMGVVWAAEDTSLGRRVAVKVLPAEFARDRQRLARFEREAKILASLNHPNVAAIHGFDHEEDLHFLVLELVPGPTLAEMLQAGPLPVDEALDVCRQVAEGLEAAHEAGVIHRDLKPGNVKVTPDGKVKVLDFGLAKGLEGTPGGSSGPDLSLSPTVTAGGTQAGLVLGTAPYMSPEQARGKPVDARTDVWSFGCLLYESLTGRRLFTGESVTDVLSAILQVDPDWSALPAKTPSRVRDLLARCLERSPRGRLHHIADARIEIERSVAAREWTTSGIAAADAAAIARAAGRRPRVSPAAAAGLLAGLAVGAGLAYLALTLAAPERPEARVRKFRLATSGGNPGLPEITRDGRKIAYLESDRVWVRELGRLDAREVAGTEGTSLFSWSPDGSWLAISKGGKLWRIPAEGGQAVLLCALPESLNPSNAAGIAWGEEGRIAYNLGSAGIMVVPEQGGAPRSVIEPSEGETDHHTVRALPGGRGYLFVVHRPEGMDTIVAVTPQGRREILRIPEATLSEAVYAPPGHLLFHRRQVNEGLWAVPFSLDRLEATGEPFPVAPDSRWGSVSEDGTLVHILPAPPRSTRLVLADRKGLVSATIGEPQLSQANPSLSPSGTSVAVETGEAGTRDVWLIDVASGLKRRLTFEASAEFAPSFHPSGGEVAFSRSGDKPGDVQILAASADGSGQTRPLARGLVGAFSRDGRFLVYSGFDEQLDRDIWYVPLAGEGKPAQLLETDGDFDPQFSPGGDYIVFASTDTGRSEIYITRFPSGEGRWQVSTDGGRRPRWSARGDRIFFFAGNDMMEASVTAGASPGLGPPRKLFTWEHASRGFDVTAGGERFVLVKETDPGAPGPQIAVIEDWIAEFASRR